MPLDAPPDVDVARPAVYWTKSFRRGRRVQGGTTKITFFWEKFGLEQKNGLECLSDAFLGISDPLNTPIYFLVQTEAWKLVLVFFKAKLDTP